MALVLVFVCGFLPEWWESPPEALQDEDETALQEETAFLLARPVDLNRATLDELLAIPWLSPVLACQILATRDSLGRFESTGQLLTVPGMTREWLALIAPVVTLVREEPDWTGDLLLRLRADTVPFGRDRAAGFGRVAIDRAPWRAAAVWEKDRGEADVLDWVGMGLGYRRDGFGVLVGDFTLGSGLGLVFSGPHRRSGAWQDAGVKGPGNLRLVRTALETRALRGAGIELVRPGWRAAAFGSYAGRDARLNSDGTVDRLVGGVHDDSASVAGRDAVDELAFGTAVSGRWKDIVISADGVWTGYSRDFAPADSAVSFHGRSLAAGGLGLDAKMSGYRVGVEAAASTGGGVSGALELSGDWQGVSAGLGLVGYGARFFAPLGRSRSLTSRKDRLYARARVGYRVAGFRVAVRGNTYRDFEADSLPARMEVKLGQRLNRFLLELKVGRSFKLEQRRSRTSRWDVSFGQDGLDVRFTAADEYPEQGSGRGRMAALALRVECGWLWGALTAARFDIAGSGVRMYLREYAPMRIGSSFGTSESAWRFGLSPGLKLSSGNRLGLKLGVTWRDAPVFDVAGQIEFGLN